MVSFTNLEEYETCECVWSPCDLARGKDWPVSLLSDSKDFWILKCQISVYPASEDEGRRRQEGRSQWTDPSIAEPPFHSWGTCGEMWSPGQDHTWLDLNSGLFVPPVLLFLPTSVKQDFTENTQVKDLKSYLASFPSLSPPFLIFLKVKSTSSTACGGFPGPLSHTLIWTGIMDLSLQAYERGWLFCSPNIQRQPLFFSVFLFLCFVLFLL